MPEVQIRITVPDGTSIIVTGLGDSASAAPAQQIDRLDVEDFWRYYLSDNAKRVYAAAARIQRVHGPGYTLDDVATNLSVSYDSVRSLHRTSGRSARKWRDDKSRPAPIELIDVSYDWVPSVNGMRTRYRLPDNVASTITELSAAG